MLVAWTKMEMGVNGGQTYFKDRLTVLDELDMRGKDK